MKYHKRSLRTFLYYLVPYLLILIISIAMLGYIYNSVISFVNKEAREQNLDMLIQASNIIDIYITEMERTANHMTFSPPINKVIYMDKPIQSKDIYYIYELQQNLFSYGILNNLLVMYYIYFKNSDVIITPSTTYLNSQLFFEHFFDKNSILYENWINDLDNSRNTSDFLSNYSIKIDSVFKKVITRIRPIPLYTPKEGLEGFIVMMLDKIELHKMFNNLYNIDQGWFYILDQNNNLILSSDDFNNENILSNIEIHNERGSIDKQINDKNMVISYIVSPLSRWTYVAALPFDIVMIKSLSIKMMIWIVGIIILIAIISIAFAFSLKNSKPLNKLMNYLFIKTTVNTYNKSKNNFKVIEDSLHEMFNKNDSLNKKLETHIYLLRAAFFDQLIHERFDMEFDIEQNMQHIELPMSDEAYLCFIIKICDSNDTSKETLSLIDKRKVLIKEIIADTKNHQYYSHDIGYDKLLIIAFIHKYDNEQTNSRLKNEINNIWYQLTSALNEKIIFAIGDICNNISDVYKSYNTAMITLENIINKNEKKFVVWFNELSEFNEWFFYPIEIESRIINLVKAGKKEETVELVNNIYEENIKNKNLPETMIKHLMFELKGTVFKILNQIDLQDIGTEVLLHAEEINYLKQKDNKQIYDNLILIYSSICDHMKKIKRTHNEDLEQKVIKYINENFFDSQLSLCSVSEEFGISEAYLSYFFKVQTGENFSGYIEKLRVDYACNLLNGSKISIEQISLKCGYNSAQSFRRAFKRVKGVNPSQLI